MKRTLLVMYVVMIVVGKMFGGSARSPEQLGANWARVSDEQEIQLIVDELCAVGRGDGNVVVVVRKHVAPLLLQLLVKQARSVGKATALSAVAAERWSVRVQGTAATVEFSSGDRLQFQKIDDVWKAISGSLPKSLSATTQGRTFSITGGSGVSVGETFIPQSVSMEHSIERLSRGVTQSKINRELFGVPEKTASYYSVRYVRGLPSAIATYVQFVLDPAWNRIVYGNMDRWIKTYSIQSPSAIAVDADGNVFVGDPANKRVQVLQLVGAGEAELQYRHSISNIANPTDIAINDDGTPFNTVDDVLYVADASKNKIYKYTAGNGQNSLIAVFDGFNSPTSIAVGRWNGTNNGLLYVVDKIAKRIRVFDEVGSSLELIREHKGDYSQYFTSIKTDHFGNVYLVDNVNSKVMKFTASLEFLDAQGGDATFAALGNIDIPFARIEIENDRRWVGFDQMFAIERWDAASGAQRRQLGIRLRAIDFRADDDVSRVDNSFVLTDVGTVTVKIFDDKTKRLVRTLGSSVMVAGEKNVPWDRRDDEGKQVAAGMYRYELGAASLYGARADEPTISNTRFYLPMYYHEDCGSTNRMNDAHSIQGSVVAWGAAPSQTAREDASSVQYRFNGLNPASDYEVAAEYVANDGVQRLQVLTANGARLHDPMQVTSVPTATGFIKLPKASYANGDVAISVNKLAGGSSIVSQLWIKEVGVAFNAQPIAALPTNYTLQQNFPNPFNPTTTIRYGIPNDAHVTLRVYSINGQEVSTLVNEEKAAGLYQLQFDAKNLSGGSLASGVYFYRVTAGSFSETKKMVLVR